MLHLAATLRMNPIALPISPRLAISTFSNIGHHPGLLPALSITISG
jgi:hypothetical protein